MTCEIILTEADISGYVTFGTCMKTGIHCMPELIIFCYLYISGYVTFEDLYEDRYTLYARADSHSSYSAVISASPDNPIRDIFLQRIAVTYTWTVTPTTVVDKYEITLDSTFETFVSF